MARRTIRPIRIVGDIAYVPLTRGMEAIIDAADVPLVEGRNWHCIPGGKTFYAATMLPRNGGKQCIVSLHCTLIESDEEVDHRDGNGLNCRRKNLRESTRHQNVINRGLFKNNKSGVTGVRFNTGKSRWTAEIRLNKKTIHLGSFHTKEEATTARHQAEKVYHGEFSRRLSE